MEAKGGRGVGQRIRRGGRSAPGTSSQGVTERERNGKSTFL